MIKKLTLTLFLVPLLFLQLGSQSYNWDQKCISTNIASIASTATATNGSEFTADSIKVSRKDHAPVVAITIQFTIAAANGDDIDFYFQASFDGGTTWTSDEFVIVDCASDVSAAATPVYHTELVNVYGVSHLRLWKVVNGDAVTAITAVNAHISGGKL